MCLILLGSRVKPTLLLKAVTNWRKLNVRERDLRSDNREINGPNPTLVRLLLYGH